MSPEQPIEQRILIVMRKVLARIIKDVTPAPGMKHPLTEGTVEDIRACLALIAARERELYEALHGQQTQERPHYTDETQAATTVLISRVRRAALAAPEQDPEAPD